MCDSCLAHAHSLSRYRISVILALRMRTVCHGTAFPLFLPCACAQSVTVQHFRYSWLAQAHSLSRYSISVIIALRMRTVCHGTTFPLFLPCACAQSVTVQNFRYSAKYRNETGNEVQIFAVKVYLFPITHKLRQPSCHNVQKPVSVQCCRTLSSWVTVLLLTLKLPSWPC